RHTLLEIDRALQSRGWFTVSSSPVLLPREYDPDSELRDLDDQITDLSRGLVGEEEKLQPESPEVNSGSFECAGVARVESLLVSHRLLLALQRCVTGPRAVRATYRAVCRWRRAVEAAH